MGNNQATPMHHSLPGKTPSKFKKMLQSVTKNSDAPPKATSIVLYPILAEHPLFQQKNDPFLLKFIEPLESALKLNPDFGPLKSAPSNFYTFIQKLKDDNQDAIKQVAPRSVFDRIVCEKSIEPQGLCFTCFDCSIKDRKEVALMCTTCFEKSNHKNHLVRAVINNKTSPEKCSCGNSDLLKAEGFCYEQWEGPKQAPEALAKILRMSRLEDYEIMLKKAFYGVFSIFEMRIRTKNPRLKSELQKLGEVYLSRLLDFCQKSYIGLNDPLLLITAKALMSSLPPKCDQLWHNCESMTPQDFEEKIMTEKTHLCKCTILAGILRLMVFMNKNDECKLCCILKDCRRVSGFGDCLAKELLRNHAFVYTLDKDFDSSLIRYEMYRFVKCQEEVFDSGHFDGLMRLLREMVGSERFPKDQELRNKVWHIFWTVLPAFLKPCYSTSQKIIKQPSFTKNILEMLKEAQRKSPSMIVIEKVNTESLEEAANGLRWSREFQHLVILCSKLLSRLPKEEKIGLSKMFVTEWVVNYEEIQRNSGEEVSLNLGMERAFCSLLSNYLRGSFSQKEIQNFFQETETAPETAKVILKRILKALGTLKYLQRMQNFDLSMPIKCLMTTYYDPSNAHFVIDIIGIQLLALAVEPLELFVLLVENYFYYDSEIQSALLGAKTENLDKNKVLLVEDFARLMRYIMKDETCQLNFDLKCSKDLLGEEINFGSRYLRVVERVVVNILLSKKFLDMFELKESIGKIIQEDPKVEKAIGKVIAFKENSREFELRKEYQEDVILEIVGFEEKYRDQENEDFIGQKLNLKDISAHLKTLQGIVFENSKLIECLKNTEMRDGLLKVTFQLMLLELEGMEEGELKSEKKKEFEEFVLKNKHSKYSRFSQGQEGKSEDDEEEKCEKEVAKAHEHIEESKLDEEPRSQCEQCHQKIEKNEVYGTPIYMGLSNNLHDEKRATVYDLEKETGLINTVWWPVISSCGHHYHQKCFEKANYRRIDNGNIYGKYESSCPTCKEVCNAFLPVSQEEKDCMNRAAIGGGGKSSIDMVSLPKRLQVMIMQILRETIVTWFYYEDLYIILIGEIFQKSYQYFIETFHIYNSPSELHQKLKLYSPFFKTFKSYFSSSSKLKLTKQTFIVEAYEQHLEILRFDSAQNQNKENIFLRFNHLPENVLNVYLASLFIDSINEPAEVIMKNQIKLFKEYLSYRLVQIINRRRINDELDLEDCLNFYFEKPDIQESIISQLIYPIKKIILGFTLNLMAGSSSDLKNSLEICEILYESASEEGLDYINRLLGAVGMDKSFDELIFETLASLSQSSDCDGPILNYMLGGEASMKKLDQIVVKKLSPQVVTLPSTYAEFNLAYAHKKCSYCDKYSLDLCLCLTCGQTLCANKCGMADPKEMHMNFHAKEFHRGNCAYISVHSPEVILVSDKDIKKTGDLVYINGLKQTVQEVFTRYPDTACLDLKKFSLDEKTGKKIKDMIICNSFRTNMSE